jgi:2-polyprenyl-3-methyl-5-hydroxy-6-metoxy-1,4-benzoquinol methylase
MSTSAFETEQALLINKKREECAEKILVPLLKSQSLKTALDVGCGFGFFTRFLGDLGLQVTACDVRQENVNETKRRNPDVQCKIGNVEELSAAEIGSYDLVFCFGLLYHLENPFRAMRNLEALTRKVLVMESVIAPFRSQSTVLFEEIQRENQGVNYIADIPSESWFIKSLYRVGYPSVYKTSVLPDYEDFHAGLLRRRRRTILLAAKNEIQSPILRLAPEPRRRVNLWYRAGINYFVK